MNLFKDIIPSLTQSKIPVLQFEEDFKEYNTIMVNRALSYFDDCIFFANEMNKYHYLDVVMQHDFYFFGLRKYKRPFVGKWVKMDVSDAEHLERIMSVLKCNRLKAKGILSLMSDEDKVKLAEEFSCGG